MVRWPLYNFTPCEISLETSNFVHGSAMWSLSLVMSECSLSGRGQCHLSNFYIVDLENFATWYPQLVCGRFVYDTYRTVEVTRSRHGWVHMFIIHCPIVTLQLRNFYFFRTCRTSSFGTVAWQLARFPLTPSSAIAEHLVPVAWNWQPDHLHRPTRSVAFFWHILPISTFLFPFYWHTQRICCYVLCKSMIDIDIDIKYLFTMCTLEQETIEITVG